jgi:hypothetical protein
MAVGIQRYVPGGAEGDGHVEGQPAAGKSQRSGYRKAVREDSDMCRSSGVRRRQNEANW